MIYYTPFVLVIVLIIILVERKKKPGNNDSESNDSEIETVRSEIMRELEKAEPDYERIKHLKEWENRLSAQDDNTAQDSGHPTVETSKKSANGKSVKNNSSFEVTGLDIALYMGSLLILAGVGGLVWSGLDALGLILLVVATILFYVGGLLLRNSEKFKRVSQVFVGTGMAMLPFIGVLLYNITKISPEIIWLTLSLVGVPIYIVATYIMNNQVFSYFAMAGLVSLACSMSSILGLGMVWYFVLVMVLGIILDFINMSKLSKKLGVMFDAVKNTGEWLPLATFVAAFAVGRSLSEIDFAILLGIIIMQFAVKLWQNYNLLWEGLLKAAMFCLIVLLSHIIVPSYQAIGVGLIIAASIELCHSFAVIIAAKKPLQDKNRFAMESGWTIFAMMCYCIASLFFADFSMEGVALPLLVALAIDSGIMIAAKFCFDSQDWYFGLIIVGMALPPVIANMLNLPFGNNSLFFVPFYLIEMGLMTGISWMMKDEEKSNLMAMTSAAIFGLAGLITCQNDFLRASVLAIAAILLGLRGLAKKQKTFCEVAVYVIALAVMEVIIHALAKTTDSAIMTATLAHVGFASLVATSLFWDDKTKRTRLIIGCIGLLIIMGGLALTGKTWFMIMFMVEAASILIFGLAGKIKTLWMAGAVALFLAAMWFTKDLYFVWPVILGLGLIGAVVGVIIYNDRKKK